MATAFVYSILAALLIAIHSTTAFRSDIHTKMIEAEKLAMFGSEEPGASYEVFPMSLTRMRRIQKSNENIKHTLHLTSGEKFTLNLKPTPQYLATKYTPVWSAVSDRHTNKKIHYRPLPTAMSDVGEFTMYQDVENAAALVVYTDPTKEIVIEGMISTRFVIRSLPKRLNKELLNDIFGKLPNPMGGAITYVEDVGFYLIIINVGFKVPPGPVTRDDIVEPVAVVVPANHEMQKHAKANKGKEKVEKIVKIPKTVFPEMLIVLDHNVVRHRTTTQALRNILAFWNGMDLIYRTLEKPKIHLNIAGIIIAADNMATPYIADASDLDSLLSKMGKHFYNERVTFPTMQYDMIIAMSAMYLPGGSSGFCTNCMSLPGYFTTMPVCSSKRNITRTKTLSNTMIIHYEGTFAIGHLIFVQDYRYEKTGGCHSENHYPRDNHQRIQWTNCSQKLYSHLLATKVTECLRNKPLSMDGQCQNEGYAESCKLTKKIGICVAKGCKTKSSKTCVRSKRVPLPGTACGSNKYCNEKKVCVRK